jgi:hypothetical protein
MAYEPLELAFAYFDASQSEDASSAEVAGRLEQARTAALLSIAESLAVLVADAEGPPAPAFAAGHRRGPPQD